LLGNPKGFETDHAISVDRISVDVNMRSLFSDTIQIKRVYIRAPDINYELALGTSNIGKILDGLSKDEEKKKKEPSEKKKGRRKVVIDDLLIEDGKVHVAAKITGGLAAPIPLATIHMTDIGKDEGGASIADVIGIVFRTILTSVTGVVTGAGKLVVEGVEGAGKLVGEGVEAVGGAAVDGAKAVGDAAGAAVKGIGSLFGGDDKKDEKDEK
jgi:uncharacterized protein involved in outer membrane biogenesis